MSGWPARVVTSALLMISLTACAGPASSVAVMELPTAPTTIPFRMQPPIPRGSLTGSFGVDHIALDGNGGYVCVLRRGDDLAALRAQFNPRGQ